MKLLTFVLCIIISSFSFSQNEWWKSDTVKERNQNNHALQDSAESLPNTVDLENIEPGKVKVVKSSSIDKLIKFKATAIPPNKTPLTDGYRIQLFFDHDKKAVDNARRDVLTSDASAETYIQYKAPNYLLLLGNFRTQLDAEKVRAEQLNNFPEAIVIKNKIEFPKVELPEEDDAEE